MIRPVRAIPPPEWACFSSITDMPCDPIQRVAMLEPPAEEWESPNGGVLIEGGGLGLFVQIHPEDSEDVVFVRRANDKP